jgi:hypothetical protein
MRTDKTVASGTVSQKKLHEPCLSFSSSDLGGSATLAGIASLESSANNDDECPTFTCEEGLWLFSLIYV